MEITSSDLEILKRVSDHPDIYKVTVSIDLGQFKINESIWSQPLGTPL